MSSFPRRIFLKHGMLAADVTVTSLNQLLGYQQLFAQRNGECIQTIMNLAATAESQEILRVNLLEDFACSYFSFSAIS